MQLIRQLDQEAFDALDEGLKENYAATEQDGNTVFLLSVEGMTHEDVSGLKSALDKQKAKVTELKTKLDAAESRNDSEDAAQWKAKYETARRTAAISEGAAAHQGNPEILQALLKDKVQMDGDRLVVLNDDGCQFSPI